MTTYTTPAGETLDLTTDDGLRALRVEIAKRLGWRAEVQASGAWRVYNATGGYMSTTPVEDEFDSEDAWRYATISFMPDWPRDANAAFTLRGDDHMTMTFLHRNNAWHVTFWNGGGLDRRGLAPTPALAICLAWLAYRDATTT